MSLSAPHLVHAPSKHKPQAGELAIVVGGFCLV
jgi:hypothetical protein